MREPGVLSPFLAAVTHCPKVPSGTDNQVEPPRESWRLNFPEKEVNRMTKNTRFSPEVRQRAVRMVLESQGEYDSQ
ncbi:Transposase (plasmid) [Shigella dysenteriae WRSd5]|nr:Transposase [Shigella dysenteriae WRSd5]